MDEMPRTTGIPVVDFSGFLSGTADQRRAVAKQIGTACESVGFLYLSNHGVPADALERIFAAAKAFFGLPQDRLMAIEATRLHYRGYLPLSVRTYAATGLPDVFEAFKMQLDLPLDDPDVLAGKPLHQVNKWPDGMPEWRSEVLSYWARMESLSHDLLRAFALALDEPEETFLSFYRKPLAQLSLLHYPSKPARAPAEQWSMQPHTDTGAFTILAQDNTGGLQVQPLSGEWIDAVPLPGAYVINIGDMMQRWTNGRFASTPHRVLNRTGKERVSIPFFMNPDFDVRIEPLPSCVTPERPLAFEPLAVGDFIWRTFTKDWK